jgi:hypothetical protein
LPAESDNCMQHRSRWQYTADKTYFKILKIMTTLKNLCTFRDPFTHQGLPNHTTSRPI